MSHQPRSHGPGHQPRDHGPGEHAGMTDHPRYQGTGEDAGVKAVREPLTARQRWVRIAVIAVVAAVFLLIVILHLTGTMKGM